MEEKSNKGFIITIIILIVIILGLGGFIAYDKFLKKESEEDLIRRAENAFKAMPSIGKWFADGGDMEDGRSA